MVTQKTILFKLALEKYEEIFSHHMKHLEKQFIKKKENERKKANLLDGKYEFFEKFKEAMVDEYYDIRVEVDDENQGGPDYHKRLLINVGYYNSYKALRTARNMPNST